MRRIQDVHPNCLSLEDQDLFFKYLCARSRANLYFGFAIVLINWATIAPFWIGESSAFLIPSLVFCLDWVHRKKSFLYARKLAERGLDVSGFSEA